MAWLESKAGVFRIRFRFAGGKHILSLKTSDARTADNALGKFESNLRLIEEGVIAAPPPEADLGTYIISGGKLDGRPSRAERVEPKTLAELFDSYLAAFPKGAKEATTWKTERIHIGHLRRLLDTKLYLSEVTPRTIQAYVTARADTVGSETVRKEVGTFTAVWNRWAVPQGMTTAPAPVTNLSYPKTRTKPPFQTREQIERQIARDAAPETASQVRKVIMMAASPQAAK
jgi:hypothetical protein